MITDAVVLLGETSPEEIAKVAAICKISRVVCITEEKIPEEISGVKLLRGKIIPKTNGKVFFEAVKKSKDEIVLVTAQENSFNRTAITTKGVHLLTGIYDLPKNGFDHIVAKMAAEKHVGVVMDLSRIIDAKTRRVALAKYAEILKLHRKFGFPLVIGSGAEDVFGLRNFTETTSLCSLFGMTEMEVEIAFSALDKILSTPKIVTIVREDQ